MFSLICTWIKSWVNNPEAGDLRHHYDVINGERYKTYVSQYTTGWKTLEWEGWDVIKNCLQFFKFDSYLNFLALLYKSYLSIYGYDLCMELHISNPWNLVQHYYDVIMNAIASQITSLMIVYSTVYSDVDQSKHQSSASLAFVWGIHRDRWIPRTKGQLRGKCFHLMTSSWNDSPKECKY